MAGPVDRALENLGTVSLSVRLDADETAAPVSEETDPRVPLLDLAPIHLPIANDLLEAVRSVLQSNRFIGGDLLDRFEQELASYCGTEHAIGVSSGTDALMASLAA